MMNANYRILPRTFCTICLAVSLLWTPGDVLAQSRVGTAAATFLTIGTGARANALGHAYTASATGAEALFWNPAGASRSYDLQHRASLAFSHATWLVDIDYNAFGLVIPVTRSGVLGLSLAQMDYGRMDVRTVTLPEGTGETFGATDMVIGLSYAQPLTDRFYIGGTGKYVRQKIYDMSATTMAVDIGFVLDTNYFGGLLLGASISNFGGEMRMGGVNSRIFVDIDEQNSGSNNALPAELETTSWDLPLSFKFGAALPVYRSQFMQLTLYGDSHQTNDNGLNADTGAQLRFSLNSLNFDLRAGYKDAALDNVTSHWTFGGGVDLNISAIRFGADFGYIPYEELGNVTVLDLRLYF
jgi:hypothetical protein